MTATADTATARSPDWAAVVAVFTLVIGFTYSDDAVEFIVNITGARFSDWRWAVGALDLLLVGGTAVLKWHMTPPPRVLGEFLRGLLSGWWAVGAVLVVALHAALAGTTSPDHRWAVANSPALTLLFTLAFVVAMALLLISAFGAGSTSRAWIAPVVIGTFVAQVASVLWNPVINANADCAGEISPDYFNAMVNVLPLLLVTLGLEVNYQRSRNAIHQPGQRAVKMLMVILLCVAEVLAFSILVKIDGDKCGVSAVWHEYIAFVATTHAAAISLATLAWLLLADSAEPS